MINIFITKQGITSWNIPTYINNEWSTDAVEWVWGRSAQWHNVSPTNAVTSILQMYYIGDLRTRRVAWRCVSAFE